MIVNTERSENACNEKVLLETEEWMRLKREKIKIKRSATCSVKELLRENRRDINRLFDRVGSLRKCEPKPRLAVTSARSGETQNIKSAKRKSPIHQHDAPGIQPERPHSVDIGGLARDKSGWVGVVPCHKVRFKESDKPPDEFKRAGIGSCFKGKCLSFQHLQL